MSSRHSNRKSLQRKVKPRKLRYSTLTESEKAEYGRAIDLLSGLRRREASYSALLRKHRLNTRKARWYLGPNLLGRGRGRPVRASKTDGLVRKLMFPRPYGDVPELIRGLPAASRLSKYFQDRAELLGGDLSIEDLRAKWRDVRIDGREVFADADAILRMADAGILDLENLYSSVGGDR